MAQWPVSKKTFTPLQDGTTKVEGVNVNRGDEEEEAVQTYLGASGNPQTKHAALINVFRHMFDPIPKITRIDNDTIEIEAKSLVMFNGNGYVIKRNSATFQITLSGNLDTGAEAASTWYNVWLTGDGASSTYSAIFSLSNSAPTGFTYYKLIGRVYNDGSSNISATHSGFTPEGQKVNAWINFDGTGTVVISNSMNVTSITDNGTGDYTVTLDIDFADLTYGTVFGGMSSPSAGFNPREVNIKHGTKAVGSFGIRTEDEGGTPIDLEDVTAIAIGNQ